ncbi:MAG: dTDP-4-dehydrorhamnose reductase [Gammaproteobacteria bacterium]|nr:dTDP-4-dehydrorhamnose reductase [Gammaproteobacteria bacterium]
MKILLLGCNGQVGWELQRSLQPLGEVIACDFDSAADRRADFTQPASVAALVDRVRPQVIVNSAAHTAVDKAETEVELARVINATTVGAVAQRAAALGALLVHYSTDYVYDGSGHSLRDEASPTGPLSVYGRTKLEGEELVRASGCRHVISRTSWVYAARGNNFIKTMLRLAAERESLSVIDDQIGAPTGADLLADVTALVIARIASNADHGRHLDGTYHCVAAGETSWFDYARFVIDWARVNGQSVKVAPDAIRAVPTSAYPTPAARPLNSRLSTAKLRTAFSLNLPDWRVGVERMLRETCGQ